jgi:hypothetical protein
VRRPQWPISVILSSITRCREAASTRVAAPSARDQRIIASPAAFVPGTIPCRANPARPTVRHSVGRRLGSENGSRPKSGTSPELQVREGFRAAVIRAPNEPSYAAWKRLAFQYLTKST